MAQQRQERKIALLVERDKALVRALKDVLGPEGAPYVLFFFFFFFLCCLFVLVSS